MQLEMEPAADPKKLWCLVRCSLPVPAWYDLTIRSRQTEFFDYCYLPSPEAHCLLYVEMAR